MAGKANEVVTLLATLAVAAGAKKAMEATWRLSSGKQPPNDPTDPEVAVREAMVWATLSGAVVGLSRMAINRQLARRKRLERAAISHGYK